MSVVLSIVFVVLLLNLLVGLVTTSMRSGLADRIVALSLFATVGTAAVLVMGQMTASPDARLVALILALLSCALVIVLAAVTGAPDDRNAAAAAAAAAAAEERR